MSSVIRSSGVGANWRSSWQVKSSSYSGQVSHTRKCNSRKRMKLNCERNRSQGQKKNPFFKGRSYKFIKISKLYCVTSSVCRENAPTPAPSLHHDDYDRLAYVLAARPTSQPTALRPAIPRSAAPRLGSALRPPVRPSRSKAVPPSLRPTVLPPLEDGAIFQRAHASMSPHSTSLPFTVPSPSPSKVPQGNPIHGSVATSLRLQSSPLIRNA